MKRWCIGILWAISGGAAGLSAPPVAETSPAGGDTASLLREQLFREAAPAKLEPVWYRPHVEQKGKTNPLAVILASKDFPVSTKDFWVPTLWKENYCSLVLTTQPPDRWNTIRLSAVLREIDDPPKEVPADPNRLLLISDTKTGPLARRFLETYPGRVAGAVFLSFAPIEITPAGPALWQPSEEVWAIPMWTVVGTSGKNAAKVLELWRKLAARAPQDTSLTVDTRVGRGLGHLLPDEAILPWLRSLRDGERPARGPDRQVEAEKKQFASLAKEIRQAVQAGAIPLPGGETVTKTDGPFRLSVCAPEGWIRDRDGEKPYNLQGPRVDEQGRTLWEEKNPYAEIYLTPRRRGPFFVRLRAARSKGQGEAVLREFESLVSARGYLPVSLERWKQEGWTYDVSTYLLAWGEGWHRWVILTAVNDDQPVAPLIMVMDATDSPDPKRFAATLQAMTDSVRAESAPQAVIPRALD